MRVTCPIFALAAIALLTAGCDNRPVIGDLTEPPAEIQARLSGTLTATAKRPSLTLRNTTDYVVGFTVNEKEGMMLRLLPPCGVERPQVAPGQAIALPYTDIDGYTVTSREVVVSWCTLRRAPDGTLQRFGDERGFTVRL